MLEAATTGSGRMKFSVRAPPTTAKRSEVVNLKSSPTGVHLSLLNITLKKKNALVMIKQKIRLFTHLKSFVLYFY